VDPRRRVLIIGLDGATLDLVEPWVAEGKLPNFGRVLADGAVGRLQSTIPPMTFPAWTSLMTGKNPGQHGVFDFTEREPDGYGIRFVNSHWIKAPTMWRTLSEAGRRIGVVSVPVTYPPSPVNGLMISGFDAPGLTRGKADARAMFPPELHQELTEKLGGYAVSASAGALVDRPDKALRAILATVDQKIRCAKYLYAKEPWDVFMVVLGETDMTGHLFWKYHDPRSPLSVAGATDAWRDAILTVYQRADAFIGDMLKSAWPSTTTILVSDHGFGGAGDTAVSLNLWLEQAGFLRFRAASRTGPLDALRARLGELTTEGIDQVKRLGRKVLPSAWKAWVFRTRRTMVNRMESYLRFGAIDWEHTRAFADENPYYPQIWLNVRGREPYGTVAPGREYEELRERLIRELRTWIDPDTGAPVVHTALPREAVYSGPYVDRSPDVLIQWNLKHGYSYVSRRSEPHRTRAAIRRLDRRERASLKSGAHRDLGLLVMVGDVVRPGTAIRDARIVDVAPTVLHLAGLPVPDDMDGKVLEDVLDEQFRRSTAVRYVRRDGGEDGAAPAEEAYSSEDTAVIEERLKSLGYIE
jgi:predicted AlkP superfamily phosphohydrolase/phosphomutase